MKYTHVTRDTSLTPRKYAFAYARIPFKYRGRELANWGLPCNTSVGCTAKKIYHFTSYAILITINVDVKT